MKQYFVLYARDVRTEHTKKYGARMLFDKAKEFGHLLNATRFALSNLPATLAAKLPLTEEAKPLAKPVETNYIVAVEFFGKYKHTDYTGDTESLITFDVVRCAQSELEETIATLSAEEQYANCIHIKRVLVGLELDVFKAGAKK